VRYRYVSQVSTRPPAFVLFGGRAPGAGYERFLENRLRDELDLRGVPIRLRFRAKDGADRRAAKRSG
jgi:GTP-binding protein